MSQSITSRRRTARRRRRASRIGSPPERRLAAQRSPHVDPLAVASPLETAGAPQRRRELEARHQPVEQGELVRLERIEALAGEALLVARERHRNRDLRLVAIRIAVARALAAKPPPPPPGARLRATTGALGRRRARRARRAGRRRRRRPSAKTSSKAPTWDWSETKTERAVQYSRRRLTGRTSVSARANPAERSGVTGTPAARRRWPERPRQRAAGRGGSSRP